jgi:hypothetical protein
MERLPKEQKGGARQAVAVSFLTENAMFTISRRNINVHYWKRSSTFGRIPHYAIFGAEHAG